MAPSVSMEVVLKDNLPFSAEVRNMIWQLVLVQENHLPIAILCKFRRGSVERSPPRTANLTALMRVNKKIREETRPIFFKYNTFAIGNRDYGSIYVPNRLALSQLFANVPKIDLVLIQSLVLHVELHGDGWSEDQVAEQGERHLDQLSSLCKAVKRRFTGVNTIEIDFIDSVGKDLATADDDVYTYDLANNLESDNIAGTIDAVQKLLGCEKLRKITLVEREWLDVEVVKEKILDADIWYKAEDTDDTVVEGTAGAQGTAAKEPVRTVAVIIESKRTTADDYSIPFASKSSEEAAE